MNELLLNIIFETMLKLVESWSSTVNILNLLQAGQSGVSILVEERDFSLP
jgi:hypothetical protein